MSRRNTNRQRMLETALRELLAASRACDGTMRTFPRLRAAESAASALLPKPAREPDSDSDRCQVCGMPDALHCRCGKVQP